MSSFHLVAWLLLTRDDGTVLLGRRDGVSYGAGLWGLPGGHVEPGEPTAVAAARETREEVGVVAGEVRPVGVSRWEERGEHGLDVFFETTSWTGEPSAVSECSEVGWFHPDALPADVLDWLPERLAQLRGGQWFDDLAVE